MIWLTADSHWGHANIIKYCNRPFSSVEEMDETLIKNWNDRVGKDDTVYHLGDFAFRGGHPKKYLDRLNGNVSLCLGNHDVEKYALEAGFFHVGQYRKVRYNKEKFIMMHYPILEWDTCHHGSYMLHGHVHGDWDHDTEYRRLDVGVDSHDYAPISIEEVVKRLEGRPHFPCHTVRLKQKRVVVQTVLTRNI